MVKHSEDDPTFKTEYLGYSEDDPALLNPNRLEGHEGYLLKVLEDTNGFLGCLSESEDDYWVPQPSHTKEVDIPAGSILLILGTGHHKQVDDQGWLDVVFEGRVVRIYHQPSQWMRYYIPWPHGAFIQAAE